MEYSVIYIRVLFIIKFIMKWTELFYYHIRKIWRCYFLRWPKHKFIISSLRYPIITSYWRESARCSSVSDIFPLSFSFFPGREISYFVTKKCQGQEQEIIDETKSPKVPGERRTNNKYPDRVIWLIKSLNNTVGWFHWRIWFLLLYTIDLPYSYVITFNYYIKTVKYPTLVVRIMWDITARNKIQTLLNRETRTDLTYSKIEWQKKQEEKNGVTKSIGSSYSHNHTARLRCISTIILFLLDDDDSFFPF